MQVAPPDRQIAPDAQVDDFARPESWISSKRVLVGNRPPLDAMAFAVLIMVAPEALVAALRVRGRRRSVLGHSLLRIGAAHPDDDRVVDRRLAACCWYHMAQCFEIALITAWMGRIVGVRLRRQSRSTDAPPGREREGAQQLAPTYTAVSIMDQADAMAAGTERGYVRRTANRAAALGESMDRVAALSTATRMWTGLSSPCRRR